MEYRTLGKTGLKVSVVGVGCSQMGGVVGERGWTGTTDEESTAVIHRAQDLGVNLLDTAESYGKGHSEDVIGQALADGRRDKFVIATKVSPITDDPDETKARQRIFEACEGSLRRLRTDFIDVYQLHAIPHEVTMPAVVEALTELQRQGKIRCFGISTNSADAMRKLLALGDLATVQPPYNLLQRQWHEAIEVAKQHDMGVIVRVPLASGALSGKYFGVRPSLDDKDRRLDRFTSERAVATFQKLSELTFLTDGGRRTMVRAALRFVLDTPGVTTVIPGAKNRAQLEENVGAASVSPLTDEERTRAIAIADAAPGFD